MDDIRHATVRTRAVPTLLAILTLGGGCERHDRAARIAAEAARQQTQQNQEMSRLNREVAEGAKRLVAADAEARQEVLAAQRDLQRQQEHVGTQRDALESERKDWATQRRTESVYAPIIATLGTTVLALLPLVLCWYLLQGLRQTDDQQIGELLIHDLVSDEPVLLPPPPPASSPTPSPVLTYQPESAGGAEDSQPP